MALFSKRNLVPQIEKNGESKDFLKFLKKLENDLDIELEPTGEVYINEDDINYGDIFKVKDKDLLYMIGDDDPDVNSEERFYITFFYSENLERDIEDGEITFLRLKKGESVFKNSSIGPFWFTDIKLNRGIKDLKSALKKL